MPKIPLYYKDDEFFNDFGTSCYINLENMVDVFPLYRHDFVEISLILDGEGIEIINEVQYPLKKGCISVCMPWHFHTLRTKPNAPIKRFICEFSLEDFFNYASIWPFARQAVFSDKSHSFSLSERNFELFCGIFNDMYACFTADDPDRETRLYMKLIEVMMTFYRLSEKEGRETPVSEQNALISNALRYIHQYFKEDITLAGVAKEVGTSPSSLRGYIKAYTGMEFQALLTDIRLRNACILLGLKAPTVKYITQNTGFNSIQTFYRIFKEVKGETPEGFRKKHWMESEGKAGYLMYNNEIWDILYYMHLHFDEDLTPEMVAHTFHISTSYLHKLVRYNLMQTFTELLREIRIHYSCGLLMSQKLPIIQIAVEVGYNNAKTFTRAFQAQIGCTPTEFRERRKSEIAVGSEEE